MKGPDFSHVSPGRLKEMGEAMMRRAELMEMNGEEKAVLRKSLIPLMQHMKRGRHELQMVIDQLIDKAAELEKCISDADRLISETLGKKSGINS